MIVTIVTVGRMKQRYLREGMQAYVTRLRPYAKTLLRSIPEASFTEDPGSRARALKKEADGLITYLDSLKDTEIIVMDERGASYSSVEFAQFLTKCKPHLAFVIGGALGLHPSVVERYRMKLSLSRFTFTHEMSVVVLLEQLYRAHTIIKGKTYHY